jgi:NTP pyrophosphatase (non-canonical NTP hydrolase)
MMVEVYEWCITRGWEPAQHRTFGDECALMHSEISEALEAYRVYGFDDFTQIELSTSENAPLPKPEGVGSEFADILIRLLHYSGVHNIDLDYEYRRKMEYNKTRPYRHGGKRL